MTIATFFNTFAGMYVAQSFCHSIVAAVLTDQAMKAWKIHDPLVRQRFRLLIVLFPIVSFPLYQAVNPDRGSTLFRLEALFDINRWLTIEIGGFVPVGVLFLVLLGLTSLVFFFQEMVPVVKHSMEPGDSEQIGSPVEPDRFMVRAAHALSIKTPEIVEIDDDEPYLFSTTGRDPVVYYTSGLRQSLSREEMEAALAHEIAHVARSRRPLLIVVFILRIIMFFNPVVLVKFRRAVTDEEKICDDIAVSLTGNPAALAQALRIFYHKPDSAQEREVWKPGDRSMSLEDRSHNLHLESRIKRLEAASSVRSTGWALPFTITFLAIAILNYYIV